MQGLVAGAYWLGVVFHPKMHVMISIHTAHSVHKHCLPQGQGPYGSPEGMDDVAGPPPHSVTKKAEGPQSGQLRAIYQCFLPSCDSSPLPEPATGVGYPPTPVLLGADLKGYLDSEKVLVTLEFCAAA